MKDVANCDSLEDASMSLSCLPAYVYMRKKERLVTKWNLGLVWVQCASDELFSYSGVEAGLTPA